MKIMIIFFSLPADLNMQHGHENLSQHAMGAEDGLYFVYEEKNFENEIFINN